MRQGDYAHALKSVQSGKRKIPLDRLSCLAVVENLTEGRFALAASLCVRLPDVFSAANCASSSSCQRRIARDTVSIVPAGPAPAPTAPPSPRRPGSSTGRRRPGPRRPLGRGRFGGGGADPERRRRRAGVQARMSRWGRGAVADRAKQRIASRRPRRPEPGRLSRVLASVQECKNFQDFRPRDLCIVTQWESTRNLSHLQFSPCHVWPRRMSRPRRPRQRSAA